MIFVHHCVSAVKKVNILDLLSLLTLLSVLSQIPILTLLSQLSLLSHISLLLIVRLLSICFLYFYTDLLQLHTLPWQKCLLLTVIIKCGSVTPLMGVSMTMAMHMNHTVGTRILLFQLFGARVASTTD